MPFDFSKRSGEKETIGIDFSRRLPTAATTITAQSVVITTLQPGLQSNAPNPLTYTALTLTGKTVSCRIEGGQKDGVYEVLFIATLSDNQVKEDSVIVRVTEEI